MTNISASLANFGTRDDCPSELGDLFENDQIIRVGRIYPLHSNKLDRHDVTECPATLTVSGMLGSDPQTFEYPVRLNLEERSSALGFVEKLWAARRVGQLLEQIQLYGRAEETVDELIKLSKKYGIVTPYTSFLADENQDFAQHSIIRQSTVQRLEKSAESVTGPQAQMDAVARAGIKDLLAPMAASPEGNAQMIGQESILAYEEEMVEEIKTIRIVGNQTLYKKGDVWLTSDVVDIDPVKERGKFTVIGRYSEEYFDLTNVNSPEENKVLASQQPGEKLALLLRGTAYLIE